MEGGAQSGGAPTPRVCHRESEFDPVVNPREYDQWRGRRRRTVRAPTSATGAIDPDVEMPPVFPGHLGAKKKEPSVFLRSRIYPGPARRLFFEIWNNFSFSRGFSVKNCWSTFFLFRITYPERIASRPFFLKGPTANQIPPTKREKKFSACVRWVREIVTEVDTRLRATAPIPLIKICRANERLVSTSAVPPPPTPDGWQDCVRWRVIVDGKGKWEGFGSIPGVGIFSCPRWGDLGKKFFLIRKKNFFLDSGVQRSKYRSFNNLFFLL